MIRKKTIKIGFLRLKEKKTGSKIHLRPLPFAFCSLFLFFVFFFVEVVSLSVCLVVSCGCNLFCGRRFERRKKKEKEMGKILLFSLDSRKRKQKMEFNFFQLCFIILFFGFLNRDGSCFTFEDTSGNGADYFLDLNSDSTLDLVLGGVILT